MAELQNEPIPFLLLHLLHRASQKADEMFADAMGSEGLTARQLVVLMIVSSKKDPSQAEICGHSGIDRSTLADIVNRLVQKGFLSRKRSRQDARRYIVRLTDEGRAVLDQTIPLALDVDAQIVGGLPDVQRRALYDALINIIGEPSPVAA